VAMWKAGCIPGIGDPVRWISMEWGMNERKTESSGYFVRRSTSPVGLRSANPTYRGLPGNTNDRCRFP
jgi:hypothetical protein